MAPRSHDKIITKKADPEELLQEQFGQRRRPEKGPFRLQVDNQTKETFATYEDAAAAGLVIKTGHPVVQVSVYDSVNGDRKVIELPSA